MIKRYLWVQNSHIDTFVVSKSPQESKIKITKFISLRYPGQKYTFNWWPALEIGNITLSNYDESICTPL